MPKLEVSVIIPVYNAETFLRTAVEAAEQQEVVKEIILVEDKSPDDSLALCLQLQQEFDKVKAFQHPDKANHGCGATRNYGLTLATCDYITFADADNYILPNRYEKDIEVFKENPDADGVYNCMGIHYYSDTSKQLFLDTVNQETLTFSNPVKPEDVPLVFLSAHPNRVEGSWGIDALTIKKSLFEKSGVFNTNLKLQQDMDLFIKMSLVGRFYAGELDKPTCIRGVHDQQRSTNVTQMDHFRYERWKSVIHWSRSSTNVSEAHKTICEERFLYFQAKTLKGLKPKFVVIQSFLKQPRMIKESFGMFDINFLNAFGRNWFTLHLISFKNKLFK
jgi:glycosyltransferase involved in cell wall biosynthesis